MRVEEEKFSTKNNEKWKTTIHKNEHIIKSILSRLNLFFNFYTNLILRLITWKIKRKTLDLYEKLKIKLRRVIIYILSISWSF